MKNRSIPALLFLSLLIATALQADIPPEPWPGPSESACQGKHEGAKCSDSATLDGVCRFNAKSLSDGRERENNSTDCKRSLGLNGAQIVSCLECKQIDAAAPATHR